MLAIGEAVMQALRSMRNDASGNLIRLAVCAVAWLVMTVVISPVLFQGGKALAEVSFGRETNRPIEWFAGWAEWSGFPAFFVLTFFLIGLFGLPFAVTWFDRGILPRGSLFSGAHQRGALGFGAMGFLIVVAVGSVATLGVGMSWKVSSFFTVFAVALACEWMFRGVLYGQLEEVVRPWTAVVLSAAVFAGFRMILPPPDFIYANPESWTLGWQMLGRLPASLVTGAFDVLACLGWGVLFAWVLRRFQSLWPGVLLHAGWLLVSGYPVGSTATVASWSALCAGFGWLWFVGVRHAKDVGY